MSLTVFLTFAALVAVSRLDSDVLLQTGRAHGLKRKEDKRENDDDNGDDN